MSEEISSETALMEASLKGSTEAFEAIVRKYQSLICAITYSATGDVEKSEELAQQAFVNAWRNLSQLKDAGRLRAWLCGIVRGIIRNYFRSQRRDIIHRSAPIEDAADTQCKEPEPVEAAISKEREMFLREAIERIPLKYREPLVLFYREGNSLKEVAEQLEMSDDTARQRVLRGRQMLKEQVAEMMETTLSQTRPGKAFTVGVMASIAGLGVKAAAAGATAATASALAATSHLGIGASIFSGVAAKVVTAAAVVTITAGAVFTYKHMTKPTRETNTPSAVSEVQKRQTEQDAGAWGAVKETTAAGEGSGGQGEPKSKFGKTTATAGAAGVSDTNSRVSERSKEGTAEQFEFKPRGVLSGLVTDVNTGNPIKGAVVHIYKGSEQHQVKSDLHGMYSFDHVDNEGQYLIWIESNEYITPDEWNRPSEYVQLKEGQQMTKHFELEMGAKVQIKVVDEQEKPVKGVRLNASYMSDESGRGPKHTVPSDAEGKAVIGGLKASEYMILAWHEDYAMAGRKVMLETRGQVESLVLTMAKGMTVKGVAICEDGLAASGWEVLAEPDWWHSSRHMSGQRIDANGCFRLPHVVAGIHKISIYMPTKDGSLRGVWSADVNLPVASGVLELKIPKASPQSRVSIAGKIEVEGQLERGFYIQAYDASGNIGSIYSVYVEPGQREFIIDGVPAGIYTLEFSLPGSSHKTFTNVQAPSEGMVFKISVDSGSFRLRGKVVDKRTGDAVKKFSVRPVGLGLGGWVEISDPNGTFEIVVLDKGQRAVQVKAEGFGLKTSGDITPDAEEPAVIELGAGALIVGKVTDEKGAAIKGATINYRHKRSMNEQPEGKYITATDSNGVFVIEDVTKDNSHQWFEISHPEYAREVRFIDVEEDRVSNVNIVLKKGGSVEGYVYDWQGQPAADVELCFADESPSPYFWKENIGRIGSAVTDSNGYYRIDRLPEELCFGFKKEPERQLGTVCAAIMPRRGQTVRLDFGGRGQIRGRLMAKGNPLAHTRLAIRGSTTECETTFEAYALSDSQGRFTFWGIPMGRRYLCCSVPGVMGGSQLVAIGRVDYEAGADVEFGDIDITIGKVEMEVTTEDMNASMQELSVSLLKCDTMAAWPAAPKIGRLLPRSATTEPYTFTNVPAGTYEAVAYYREILAVHKKVEVTPANDEIKVSLRIPSGSAALSGRIHADKDSASLQLTLMSVEEDWCVLIQPTQDGSFRVGNVPAGRYVLVRYDGRRVVPNEITLNVGQEKVLDVNLGELQWPAEGYMVVCVIADDGQPLSGAEVWLERAGQIIRPHFDSDKGKSYTGEPGEYMLRAEYRGYKPVNQKVEMKSQRAFNVQEILRPVVMRMSKN